MFHELSALFTFHFLVSSAQGMVHTGKLSIKSISDEAPAICFGDTLRLMVLNNG